MSGFGDYEHVADRRKSGIGKIIQILSGLFVLVALVLICDPSARACHLRAAFIGDSYTEGYLAPPGTRWSTLVSQRMGWDEHNFGRGGTGYVKRSRYGPPFREMIEEAAASNPDIVVLSGGVNDYLDTHTQPADIAESVPSTYEALRHRLPNARIIAIGPAYTYHVSQGLTRFDHQVADAASAIDAQFISLMYPPVITGAMVLADGLHLNTVGHESLAERVISSLNSS